MGDTLYDIRLGSVGYDGENMGGSLQIIIDAPPPDSWGEKAPPMLTKSPDPRTRWG